MNRKYFWTKEYLSDLYLNRKLTIRQIAKKLNVNRSQIFYWLKKYNIPRRENNVIVKGHLINLGTKKSLKTRQKISLAHKGKVHTEETKKKISLTKRRTKCHEGKRNGRYIDGRTPLVQLIRHCFKMKEMKQKVFDRDSFTCQYCNKKGGDLDIHHIIPFYILLNLFFSKYSYLNKKLDKQKLIDLSIKDSLLYDIDNCIVLCKTCHNITKTNLVLNTVK